MAPTVILQCIRCGGLLLASEGQKTRSCPYCSLRVDLTKAKRIAKAQSAQEASEMLKKIKAERQDNTRKNKPK